VTKILDATAAIRKASALRALCLRLPHVATPTEMTRLRRFEALADSPVSATGGDVEALVAGWRRWWYEGESERLCAMAARLPAGFVDGDRRLAHYACAAASAVRR
jgi:hypothetical protein